MILIKHRYSETTLCEFNVETIKEAAEKGKTNLYEANLRGADLRGAKIDGEVINKTPTALTGLIYWCLITEGFMRLGCKRFSHQEWAGFSDDQIEEMDSEALEFWKQWKEPLLVMCKAHRGEI